MVATIERETNRIGNLGNMMPKPNSPPTKQVRFRIDLTKMLDVIASDRELGIPELTDVLFRAIIEREYRASVERLNKLSTDKKPMKKD